MRFDLLAEQKTIASARAPTHAATDSTPLTRDELKRLERENIVAALKQAGGKLFGQKGAAELLGMKPTTLASRIRALGIEQKDRSMTGPVPKGKIKMRNKPGS